MEIVIKIDEDENFKFFENVYKEKGLNPVDVIKMKIIETLHKSRLGFDFVENVNEFTDESNGIITEFATKMKKYGISQNDVALALDLTQSSVSKALSQKSERSSLYQIIVKEGDVVYAKSLIEKYNLSNEIKDYIKDKYKEKDTVLFVQLVCAYLIEKSNIIGKNIDFLKIIKDLERILTLANNKRGDSTREHFKFEGEFVEILNDDGVQEIMVVSEIIGKIELFVKFIALFDKSQYNSQHIKNSKAILN